MPSMSRIVQDFKTMTLKEAIAYIFAIVSFIIGFSLVVIGFFMPPQGEVSSSALFILGEALSFSGAVIGISFHYRGELENFKSEVRRTINKDEIEED